MIIGYIQPSLQLLRQYASFTAYDLYSANQSPINNFYEFGPIDLQFGERNGFTFVMHVMAPSPYVFLGENDGNYFNLVSQNIHLNCYFTYLKFRRSQFTQFPLLA